MELRDVVDALVALDDEQRAITNEINRALDGLGRAVLPSSRFGVGADRLAALEERLAYGSDETATLKELAETIRERTSDRALELGRDVAAGRRTREDARGLLSEQLAQAHAAAELLGRLKYLLGRRGDAEERLAETSSAIGEDEETTELIHVVLSARHAASERFAHDSRAFLVEAEAAAEADGTLAGTAANIRALRDALAGGQTPEAVAHDLVGRVVDAAVQLGQQRDELRRRLASLARDAERRQEISHGLFQAVTKASEVLDLASRLQHELDRAPLPDGALGPLKAACIEHGVITLLLALRQIRLDRAALDNAVSQLSAALGELFTAISQQPERVEQLGRLWDDLASVDAGAIEHDWEDAYAEVLGVRRDGDGMLSVSPEDLGQLAGADGLDPWLDQLVRRVDAKVENVGHLVGRLEAADEVLSELIQEDDAASGLAGAAKCALASFVGEVSHATHEYYDQVRTLLHDPRSGFRRVQEQVAGFGHAEELTPDATVEERNRAFGATLQEVRELYAELEAQLPSGDDTDRWRAAEDEARNQTAGAYRSLAATLARLQRLRELVFQGWPPACEQALELAARLRREPEALAACVPVDTAKADYLGETLEALYAEKQYYENLALPHGSEVKPVAGLSRERKRRLLDLYGASLTLLFRLLEELGRDFESLDDDDRPGHLSWMEELLVHASDELEHDLACLEDSLFELADNAERRDRYLLAFDAYHRWASRLADSESGHDIVAHRGTSPFEQCESRLGRLGAQLIEELDRENADWRISSIVESLVELYRTLDAELVDRPTMTDVRGQLADLRERAEAVRERIAADADARPDDDSAGLLFA